MPAHSQISVTLIAQVRLAPDAVAALARLGGVRRHQVGDHFRHSIEHAARLKHARDGAAASGLVTLALDDLRTLPELRALR